MSEINGLRIAVVCKSHREVCNIIEDLIWSNAGRFSKINRTRGRVLTKRGDVICFYTLSSRCLDGISADVVVSNPFSISDNDYFILQQLTCRSKLENRIWTFADFERFLEGL